MLESKTGVLAIAGVGFFLFAFIIMGFLPWTIYKDQPELTALQLAEKGLTHEFVDLAERFPDEFREYFGEPTYESMAEALTLGRKVYVGEACWHCHSQFVRPVSREDIRWGPVAHSREYSNVLQRPVLFGTRRVGPDLSREAARHSNDWHVAHFFKPTSVVPTSVMPTYPWFFDENHVPNKKGMAIITYVQWLGSWLDEYPYYEDAIQKSPIPESVSANGEAERNDESDEKA
jgi:cytochrome c oxidase cbb3-type subunit II